MIVEPVTLPPDARVADALALMARYRISGVPITDDDGRLVGILTNRDLRFETDTAQPVSALMTARDLVTAPGRHDARGGAARSCTGTRSRSCRSSTRTGRLKGLITVKDIQKRIEFPHATKDERGRLRVGAAVGVGPDALERAEALVGAERGRARRRHGARPLARASSRWRARSRTRFDVEVIAGNIATGRGGRGARSTRAPTRSRSGSGRGASRPARAC